MLIKAGVDMSDNDIEFLEQILKNIISANQFDRMEGVQMLRDQIKYMKKRKNNADKSGG